MIREMMYWKIYEDITQGPLKGIDLFLCKSQRQIPKYKSDVSTFLKSQKVYQITKSENHTINKPIMSSSLMRDMGLTA
jgi:hypothetical protein